jgi:hypothetical protein
MARELGSKFICFNCGTKFYDLHKPEPLCPKCGANQHEIPAKASPASERRRARQAEPVAAAEPEEAEKEAPAGEAEEAEDEDEDEDDDEDDDD